MQERTAKEQFVQDLVDNEKVLAQTILAEEKSDEEITQTLGFDQAQIDTMRSRLASFDVDEKAEEANAETEAANTEAADAATGEQTEEGDEAEKTDGEGDASGDGEGTAEDTKAEDGVETTDGEEEKKDEAVA